MKQFKPYIFLLASLLMISLSSHSQPVIIEVLTTPADCYGSATGTVSFAVTGGVKPYYYYLIKGGTTVASTQTNDTVYTFFNVEPGIYICMVEDKNSDVDFRTRTVGEPTPVNISSVTITPITCTGYADGEIDVSATGESGNYNFLLRPLGITTTTGSFNSLAPGNYRVVVSDAGGCASKDSTDILVLSDPPSVSVSGESSTDLSCKGSNDGNITITASGGTGAYTFTLNPGGLFNSTGIFNNLSPGNYTVEVTDVNSCPSATSNLLSISEPDVLEFSSESSENTSCFEINDGKITVTATGGTAPYSYTLNPGGSNNSTGIFTGLAPGSYTVSLTDTKSCGPVISNELIINRPEAIIINSVTSSDITCNNNNDGKITVTASGGNAPLTYTLNPGAVPNLTGIFENLPEGIYTVTVTDTKGCNPASTSSININNPAIIAISDQSHTNITCNGGNDGSILVAASGGTGTLYYTLSPGSLTNTSGSFSALTAGSYSISVTDDNACPDASTGLITLTEPAELLFLTQTPTDISCYGANDGSVNVTASGGTLPYSFTINPGGTSNSTGIFTGLGPGTYTVSLTDAGSCGPVLGNDLVINEPDALQMSLEKTNVTCYGSMDGTITVTASGGTPPYQYSRNGITYQASNVFTNLSENNYTIWVRDFNSCIITGSVSVTEPFELLINSEITISGNLCYGDSLGEIRILSVSGGTTPYEYSINGGISYSSSSVFLNLPEGYYQTMVRDANGCSASGNNNYISQPSKLRIVDYSQLDVTGCFGNTNGQIAIEAVGGTGTRRYSLDGDPSNTTGIFTSVGGGDHYIAITDDNNCLKDTTVFIDQPPPLIFSSLTLTDITGCNGDATGAINVIAGGGSGGYQYKLNTGSFLASGNFSNLPAGDHLITIKDVNNCLKDTTVSLTEPLALSLSSVTKTDILCAGLANGNITATAAGGSIPYSYTLNPGAINNSTGIFDDLSPGTYTVTLNDAFGCGPLTSSPVVITEPPALNIDAINHIPITCSGDNNGEIQISASGGTPQLEYSIDNGMNYFSTSSFTGLFPDTYFISLKDGNNCLVISDTIVMTDPDPMVMVNESSTDVALCFGHLTGSLNYEVTGGTGPLEYSTDGLNWQSTGMFTNMSAGTYVVTARDSMFCFLNSSDLLIDQPSQITANISSTPYLDEFNKGTISITDPSGGTGSLEFSINGMAGPFTSETQYTGLEASTYTVVIRDQNNCNHTENVDVSSVPPLNVTVALNDPTCSGSTDGSIRMTPVDPDGIVQYSIDDSATWHSNNNFVLLAPGVYSILARDEAGRYFTDVVTLYDPLPINIMSSVTPASCSAFSPDASIIITATGGTGTRTFLWNDGVTTKDRENINAGDYSLTVTDQNGCEKQTTVNVPATITVTAFAGEDTTICEGTTLMLNGQGGTDALWSPPAGLSDPNILNPVVTITEAVSYVLTITGMDDCYDVDTIHIDVYPSLGLSAGNDTSVIKNMPLQLNSAGGPYISYVWEPSAGLDDPAAPDPLVTLSASQVFIVTATDENGCIEKDTISINVVENLIIYSSFSPNDDGINDFWDIDSAELFPDILVEVFNRWGEKLFSSKGYSSEKRWNGYYKGKKVPIGTYYYVVIPYKGANPISGPVTIVR